MRSRQRPRSGYDPAPRCSSHRQPAVHVDRATVEVVALDYEAHRAPDVLGLGALGGFDKELHTIADCDWIIEAVVERLDLKQALLHKVEAHRPAGSIVSSNTSGIPIAAIAEGRSDEFRRHWLGTHFFNPPRYLRLLEVIPTADTDPAVVARIGTFADHYLGKGMVIAKDTPNFIANNIGLFGVMRILDVLASGRYTIEEIDAMTGPAVEF